MGAGRWVTRRLVALAFSGAFFALPGLAFAGDEECLECHGSVDKVREAAEALGVTLAAERTERLVFHAAAPGNVHEGLGCAECHPEAGELPHPQGMTRANPCATCHEDAVVQINRSAHRDPLGGTSVRAPCWTCHGAHDIRPSRDRASTLTPAHVAGRCLACHKKGEYLVGVHGQGVNLAGLDVAATCVSCHGGHDILAPSQTGSRVARRNISFTCGSCHARLAETYRASVHGAALTEHDNPDVPTCVDCHEAHGTIDPSLPRFRLASPEICGKCHRQAGLMAKYGLSTKVFSTYVADFHGTTAELFRAVTPDQPLNQAVCYDCHGHHDVESVRTTGAAAVDARMLLRCQRCHEGAGGKFISAWTGHYVPSPEKYPWIYYVRLFYQVAIPATMGFFLLYIAVDVWGRRRRRRSE